MLSLKPIIKEYGEHICLRCLNRRFEVHLAHRDVIETGPLDCPCCGRMLNVVSGLRMSGRIKLIGKRV